MLGPFLTYEQQIDKLVNEKGLIVSNRELEIEQLKRVSYFALIDGYKFPLRNPMTRKYHPGTTFEDVVALFDFDAQLRALFTEALIRVERKLRSAVSYAFCEKEGTDQARYLDAGCYNDSREFQSTVKKLLSLLDGLAKKNTEYAYIVHQREKHGNVPLWVLVNAMSFGQVSKMYSCLKHHVKAEVAKQYEHVNEKELETHLKVLVLFRNCCAHGERLFSHTVYTDIPDTPLHSKLGIAKNGKQYVKGKHDLFAAVIALRYLMPKDEFLPFKRKLQSLIAEFVRNNDAIQGDDLLDLMGFPKNWRKMTSYEL